MKKIFFILIITFVYGCVSTPEKDTPTEKPTSKDISKSLSYVVAYSIYEYPYIFSNNRFDDITYVDIETKNEILVTDIVEIKDFNEIKGQKILDDLYNETLIIMRRRDNYYQLNDLGKIYDSRQKELASTKKSILLKNEFKKFYNYIDASNFRRKMLNK